MQGVAIHRLFRFRIFWVLMRVLSVCATLGLIFSILRHFSAPHFFPSWKCVIMCLPWSMLFRCIFSQLILLYCLRLLKKNTFLASSYKEYIEMCLHANRKILLFVYIFIKWRIFRYVQILIIFCSNTHKVRKICQSKSARLGRQIKEYRKKDPEELLRVAKC